jgi:hypothetical protein
MLQTSIRGSLLLLLLLLAAAARDFRVMQQHVVDWECWCQNLLYNKSRIRKKSILHADYKGEGDLIKSSFSGSQFHFLSNSVTHCQTRFWWHGFVMLVLKRPQPPNTWACCCRFLSMNASCRGCQRHRQLALSMQRWHEECSQGWKSSSVKDSDQSLPKVLPNLAYGTAF